MANLTESDLIAVGTWAEALTKSKGYQDSALAEDFLEQFISDLPLRLLHNNSTVPFSEKFSLRRIQLLFGFLTAVKNKKDVNIADVGGGNGYMYDWIKQAKIGINLNWTVYESKKIAENYMAASTGLGITFSELKHFNTEKQFDLTIISCALQYLENWEEVLVTASKNSDYLLIMRTPIVLSPVHNYFIQKNDIGIYGKSGSSWPFIIFSKNLFEEILSRLGDITIFCTDSQEVFPYNKRNIPMSAYLLKST
jgi:putative methyltransferase (TIGR04325 family)